MKKNEQNKQVCYEVLYELLQKKHERRPSAKVKNLALRKKLKRK